MALLHQVQPNHQALVPLAPARAAAGPAVEAWLPEHLSRHLPLCAVLLVPLLLFAGSPVLALFAGMAIGLGGGRALFVQADAMGKLALQAAIVLLAFRMDFSVLQSLGGSYAGWIALFVVSTLATGLLFGRLLGVERPLAQLISAGTAICGATAIAAVAPGVRAKADQLAVALAVVFLLNAVAMLCFPAIGHALNLSQEQFGIWAALAVHDTASVVATASAYGDEAAVVATATKLIRTLFLVPVLLFFAHSCGGSTAQRPAFLPTFVVLFLAAVLLQTFLPLPQLLAQGANLLSSSLLVLALFLIGAGFRPAILHNLRGRGVVQAIALWALVVPLTLAAVLLL